MSDCYKENFDCGSEIWNRNRIVTCPGCKIDISIENISCETCIDNRISIIENLKNEIIQLKKELGKRNAQNDN